jgi:CHAT domain-containing protein
MATRERVLAALRAATVFHFAGHAVFDDVRPERSYLALAGREPHTERLTADEVSRLHLDQVRLVVLSSCETMPGRSTSSGLAGLSGALLAAGAKGVVGSLWRVDDRLTRSLMTELHRQYVATGDGAEALRAAQLALLHSTEPTRRSPAAWAAFRYAGE